MGSLEAHGINVATSYINAVMIGVVTPEKRSLILYFCEKKCKNGHVWPIISEQAQTISINYSALIDIMGEDN